MGSRPLMGGALLFLFSAALYMSVFLSILAPVPLIWANLSRGRSFALVVTALNAALVFAFSRWPGLAGYLVFSVVTGWGLAELARIRLGKRERSHQGVAKNLFWLLVSSALSVLLMALIAVGVWTKVAHVAPWAELNRGLDWVGQEMLKHAPPGSMDAADWAIQKDEWLRNFPSNLVIAVLLQCWVAMTLMLRLNPGRIRERLGIPASFQRLWRNPESLVWPTILAGFGSVGLTGVWADISWNLLKVFLALYGIQGLAILSGIFDLWKLRGFMRALSFFLVFTVMFPLLLALGFFDLWFDFRAKLRQS
ncbi:DUF2232 domain-containing protein [bacterium]|nr:DUF2232 domain-containing protein [bacterium]